MAAEPLQVEWQDTKLEVSKAGGLPVIAEGEQGGKVYAWE